MSIVLVKDFNVSGGVYTSLINSDTPLTIEQDGSIDDINAITHTTFYVFNDGKRKDPTFDPTTGTAMNLRYSSITVTPKPFSTTIKSGTSAGTSTKIYLTETMKTVPGGTGELKINVGTVLQFSSGVDTENALVKAIKTDGVGNYVDLVRNYKGSSTTGSPLNLVAGSTVVASIKHIYMTTNINSWPTTGGNSIMLSDITNEISIPVVNPDAGSYQPVFIKAVPQLNKGVLSTSPDYLGRIPTQFKTDVYFEISYRELPR